MIITDDTPSSPTKAQQALSEAPAPDTRDNMPPPAYPGPSSYQNALPLQSSQPLLSPQADDFEYEPVEPAGRRFLKAFALAALTYCVLGLFTQGTVAIAQRGNRRGGWIRVNPRIQVDRDMYGWPLVSDGKIVQCVAGRSNWDNDYAGVRPSKSFELPLSSDVLYLFSRGRLSQGNVHIVHDADWRNPSSVKVDVSLHHASTEILDRISVCQLERQEGHSGVGIFTPLRWPFWSDSAFRFNVTVHIPMTDAALGPTLVSALETSLPHFYQHVGDLNGDVIFDSLSLRSTNAPIHVEPGESDPVHSPTTNDAIEGNFYTSDGLTLMTTNAPIKADVVLYHDAKGNSTAVTIKTTNDPITANVHLISKAPALTGGNYSVAAQTTNGPLRLSFPESALDAQLDVRARTTNAMADVRMHRAFEGTFELRTTNGHIEVPFDQNATDPSGRGRIRQLSVSQRNKLVTGCVNWGGAASEGRVEVQSTNGPIAMRLPLVSLMFLYPPCGRQNECPQFASSAAHGLFHREHSGVVSVVERTNLREAEDPRNVVLFAQMRPLTLAGSSRASSSEDVAATSVRDPASELLREPRK
ncbi:hypothetical protein POSPLADRAFT_1047004 [Postia placenta MAD-698-R-SB12]|uniref:Uncharacterized protein n=1 Tax=Postia placenta MAD-698-R-SB12 TaxID=670580 RepID=A0A1X6MZC2_9APHY|nr:hypothetical protein POSPLADRAFT_1047004 [Postia placenta MAD-698-R-SB12]OSX61721.1 hypothetical protein POSPLADRAFT_1047004 [Postia placenta MAD-698-R-SB12]